MNINPSEFKATIMNATPNQIKQLTQEERNTLKLAIKSLSKGEKLENPKFENLKNRLNTILDEKPDYPIKPLHKLRSLVKGIANRLPIFGRISSEKLVKEVGKFGNEVKKDLRNKLKDWAHESINSDREKYDLNAQIKVQTEYESRKATMDLILSCFNNKAASLSINGPNITSLPDVFSFLPQLKELNLTNLPIDSLPDSFQNCKQLTSLTIQGTNINSIEGFIASLDKLQTVDLSSNKLTSIGMGIGYLKNLEKLDISGNQLTKISKDLEKCTKLETLNFTGNNDLKIDGFPKEIIEKTNVVISNESIEGTGIKAEEWEPFEVKAKLEGTLKNWVSSHSKQYESDANVIANSIRECIEKKTDRLVISGFGINSVPDVFSNLPHIKSLTISLSNNQSKLPDSIGECKQLESLRINAQLKSIPNYIMGFKGLESLYLESNLIESIPDELCELKNLKHIELGANKITSVPKKIGEMTQLEILKLEQNEIASIPEEIGNLKNLKTLILINNKLETIPTQIGECNGLKILNLDGNRLTSLPAELSQCSELDTLTIKYNYTFDITYNPDKTINNFPQDIFLKTKVSELDTSQTLIKDKLDSLPRKK